MLPTDHANSLVVICLTSCQLLCLPLPFISDKFVIFIHEKASPVLSLRALRQSQQWKICTDNLQVQNWNHIRLHSVEITQATRQRFNTNWRHGIAKNELKLISTCYKLGSRQRVIFTQHLTVWILRHSLRIPYVLATNWAMQAIVLLLVNYPCCFHHAFQILSFLILLCFTLMIMSKWAFQ